MVRVVVVEDERKYAEQLEQFVYRYGEEHGVEFSVRFFSSGVDFISDYSSQADIVFMDIEMPQMNGMDCAVKLRKTDANVPLIFVTSSTHYAVRGYEVDAIGYMVKPVVYFPFSVLMDKVMTRIAQAEGKEIFVQNREYVKRLTSKEIHYVEVMDHYLIYHTEEGEFRGIGKMKDVESQLSGSDYFRCGNSYLVNLRYVQEIDDNRAVVGKDEIFISRRRKKDFLIALNNFLKGGGL